MTAHDQSSSFDIVGRSRLAGLLKSTVRLRIAVAGWIRTAANYYAAAALYEQLSGLSDSELRRRGLSRANLAHDVVAACDDVRSPSQMSADPDCSPQERFKVWNILF
jgi:hypothetical protein